MAKIIIITAGIFLLIFQYFSATIPINTQFLIFITGIVLLGVPHGAADFLIANKTASSSKKRFSNTRFFVNYLGRLILFAATFWFFPIVANFLFIFFAAYHFGETDLAKFHTDTFAGKLFVVSYGLLILGVILLHHFSEVKPLLLLFKSGQEQLSLIMWIETNLYFLLSIIAVTFFASTFFYFSSVETKNFNKDIFLIRLAFILFILFNLSMILGFTFYFIVWHSVLSLNNIIIYLRMGNLYSTRRILKQIVFYSVLALVGIGLTGAAGFMFVNTSTITVYVFLGLAVLTAPHMEIMHEMYNKLRPLTKR